MVEQGNLVLTRKVGESIKIGTDIVVTVLKVRGKHVTLCTTAPKTQKVLRSELVDKEEP